MAAPQIPNLSTLRSARGNIGSTGRGRGRRRGQGLRQESFLPPPGFEQGEQEEDSKVNQAAAKVQIIQSTDQDASISRWSAVQAGYLRDPFAHFFTPSPAPRRFPIINRGTYVRTTAIDNLVSLFLSQSPSIQKQIISLGAGSDTRFFRLTSSSSTPLIYHELDFAPNTAAKIATIVDSPALTQGIQPPITIVDRARDALHSPNYHIHPIDLRTLDPSLPSSSPILPHINTNLPTLLISECCLCYLPPDAADSVITFFTKHLFPPSTPLGMLLYEPIKPSDAFGRVMVSNLAARGIELHTLARYDSLDAQRERLRKYGLGGVGDGGEGGREGGEERGGVRAKDIDECWEKGVPAEEKRRVASLEMVDEVEEWKLLAQHYCVAWGWREREVEVAIGVRMEGEVNGEEIEKKNQAEGDESIGNEDDDNDVWKRWRAET